MGKKDGLIILWPAYFDIDRSQAEGRRVPKSLAVESPTAEEIYEACIGLKKSPVLEGKKKMPRATWGRTGRVLIKKEGAKLKSIKEVASSMQRRRASALKK